jgi:hypothetical protein
MNRRIFSISVLTLAISSFALAQAPSIDGKWSAQVMGRGGEATERIYTFKQTGSTFTGSFLNGQGTETAMAGGTISADGKIEFTQQGRGGEVKWKGQITGDTLKFAPDLPPADPAAPAGRGGGRGGMAPVEAKRVK